MNVKFARHAIHYSYTYHYVAPNTQIRHETTHGNKTRNKKSIFTPFGRTKIKEASHLDPAMDTAHRRRRNWEKIGGGGMPSGFICFICVEHELSPS